MPYNSNKTTLIYKSKQMKHTNVLITLQLELYVINAEKAEMKPIDSLNRKRHKKIDMLKAEFEHAINILKIMDDI